ELATSALRDGGDPALAARDYAWITTEEQMGMGFILPFALVSVAIPQETFVHSTRAVLGRVAVAFLRALGLLLRALCAALQRLAVLMERLYDLPLFLPLWLEARLASGRAARIQAPEPLREAAP